MDGPLAECSDCWVWNAELAGHDHPVVVLDAARRVVRANTPGSELFEPGALFLDAVHPQLQSRTRAAADGFSRSDAAFSFETVVLARDRRWYIAKWNWLKRNAAGHRVGSGRQLGLAGRIKMLGHLAGLTPREVEIVGLVCHAYSNGNIGARLGIAEGTVKAHIRTVFRKLGITDRRVLMGRVLGF